MPSTIQESDSEYPGDFFSAQNQSKQHARFEKTKKNFPILQKSSY